MGAEWTLDELVARVAGALDAADYPGAPNGRVREVPDRRAIRWYTTIGLLDRPGGMRGRTALYGPRHLAQLMAIKRRQAQGRSLAEIQAELVGVTDPVLYGIAGLDPEQAAEAPRRVSEAPKAPVEKRRAFWAEPVTATAPGTVHGTYQDVLTGVPLEGGAVLLLPARPDHDDIAALRAAAEPLMTLLAARGLLHGDARSSR